MTRKQRGWALELTAIVVATFLLAIVAPGLINQHDTMLTYAAFAMLFGAVCWWGYFIYRVSEGNEK